MEGTGGEKLTYFFLLRFLIALSLCRRGFFLSLSHTHARTNPRTLVLFLIRLLSSFYFKRDLVTILCLLVSLHEQRRGENVELRICGQRGSLFVCSSFSLHITSCFQTEPLLWYTFTCFNNSFIFLSF